MRRMLPFAVGLIIFCYSALSQVPRWVNYTNTDYMRKIIIQGDSILWIASTGGLVRFCLSDFQFKVFTSSDGLSGSEALSVGIDSSGNVWVGTSQNGIFRFDGSSWAKFTNQDTSGGVLYRIFYAVGVDYRNNKWFGTSSGVNKYNDTSWVTYLDGQDIHSIAAVSRDSIWIGQILFNGQNWVDYRDSADGIGPGGIVLDILPRGTGEVWFATSFGTGGVYVYSGGRWSTYNTANSGLAADDVYGITEDSLRQIWFATAGGISKFDGANWQTFNKSNGLPINSTTDIVVDNTQNFWTTTNGAGLVKYDGLGWRSYRQNQIADNEVQRIFVDKAGYVWAGTRRGLCKVDGSQWTTYTNPEGVISNAITDIAQDSLGRLWVSSYGGLACFDGGEWRTYTYRNSPLPGGLVTCVEVDHAGNIWMSSTADGALRFSPSDSQWTHFNSANSGLRAIADHVFDITVDDSGIVWLACWGGLNKFDGSRWTYYDSSNSGVSSVWILRAYNDRRGNLWFGTWDQGVIKFDGNNWTRFDKTNSGISANMVAAIGNDASGNYWFCTPPSGVTKFDGRTWRSYAQNDGLATNGATDMAIDKNGNKWFCSDGGNIPKLDWLMGMPRPGPGAGGVSVFNENGLTEVRRPLQVPEAFVMFQNFPNPFNPSTTIRYGILHRSHVYLNIYNILGQQVAKLVNGEQEAGYHEVKFDASGLASGVYFYRLTAGSFVETKKLLLLR